MPTDITPRTSTDSYLDNTFQGVFGSGYLYAAGADVLAQIMFGTPQATTDTIEDKYLYNGQVVNLQAPTGKVISSLAFKSAVTGTPATVSGYLAERQSLGIVTTIGSASFNPQQSVIAGYVNSDGTVAAGTGFTVNHSGTGIYQITLAVAMSFPVAVANATNNNRVAISSTSSTTLFTIEIFAAATGALVDSQFLFHVASA